MAINKDALLALLELVDSGEGEPKQKHQEPPQQQAPPANPDAVTKAELEARLAELEAANQKGKEENPATQDPVKTKNDDEEDDEIKQLREKIKQQETERVQEAVKNGLLTSGLDEDHFSVLSEFIEYDKLKGEDGSADEEKTTALVDALTSIALRKPPAPKSNPASFGPSNQGLKKYLDMKTS